MGKGSQLDIVVGDDLHRIAIGLGGVGLAIHHEGLRGLAEVLVHHGGEAALPGDGRLSGLGDGLDIAKQDVVQLGLGRERGAVVQAGHAIVGDDTVVLDHGNDVAAAGADAEVELAVQTDELVRTLLIGSTHHEELGEIRILRLILDVTETDGLGLEEADGGEGPAGTAATLVLDGSDRSGLHSRKSELREYGSRRALLLGKRRNTYAYQGGGNDGKSFHCKMLFLVFIYKYNKRMAEICHPWEKV